jgi:hypothetical protein
MNPIPLVHLHKLHWFEDRWMVASWCDEWLTTLCGLILGKVLQVQVAAWLALVQWRTSAKGRYRWGLQVWRRQVGLVRGTRWPVESSAVRMVARSARWSHGPFLGWDGTTWEPSDEWRLAEATPSLRGFQWFTRRPLGSLVDPQRQDRRTKDRGEVGLDRSDRWVWPVCDDTVWRLQRGGHASGSQGLRRG